MAVHIERCKYAWAVRTEQGTQPLGKVVADATGRDYDDHDDAEETPYLQLDHEAVTELLEDVGIGPVHSWVEGKAAGGRSHIKVEQIRQLLADHRDVWMLSVEQWQHAEGAMPTIEWKAYSPRAFAPGCSFISGPTKESLYYQLRAVLLEDYDDEALETVDDSIKPPPEEGGSDD